jgi:hypothetical protein
MSTLLVLYISYLGVPSSKTYTLPAKQCVMRAVQIRQRVKVGRVKVFCDGRRI